MTVTKENRENPIIRTFRELRGEMKKVIWPSRDETVRLTTVVIIVSAAISLILAFADFIFTSLLGLLQNLVR